jgi:PhzF family phenazine biosynthesis protein
LSKIHVRSFAPAHGVPEDPVCGSGNLSVGVFLRETRQTGRFGEQYVARQGMQLGRDGRVSVRLGERIEIGGHAVTCVEGTLRIT